MLGLGSVLERFCLRGNDWFVSDCFASDGVWSGGLWGV